MPLGLSVLSPLRAGALALLVALSLAKADAVTSPTPNLPTDKDAIDNPVQKPAPRYPQEAYDADIEGVVLLEIVIEPDGRVSSVKVLKAEPPGWFEDAAVEAVKQWRYRPSGRRIVTNVEIAFKISPSTTAP